MRESPHPGASASSFGIPALGSVGLSPTTAAAKLHARTEPVVRPEFPYPLKRAMEPIDNRGDHEYESGDDLSERELVIDESDSDETTTWGTDAQGTAIGCGEMSDPCAIGTEQPSGSEAPSHLAGEILERPQPEGGQGAPSRQTFAAMRVANVDGANMMEEIVSTMEEKKTTPTRALMQSCC